MDKKRILIADDHAIVRAGFRRLIDQMDGIAICGEIANGEELSAFLEENATDLLLVDLTMPHFDPISAIEHIRDRYPNLKILVVSAYDDQLYVKRLFEIGVHGYHLKDEPLRTLETAIRRVLDGEQWIAEPLFKKMITNNQAESDLPHLTERQKAILRCLHRGCDNKHIAAELDLSIKTVESHLTNIYRTLNVQSRLETLNYIHRYPQVLGVDGQKILQPELPTISNPLEQTGILVLDDSTRFRKQLLHMIGKADQKAKIYEAETIAEAIDLVRLVPIRLAFLDVILKDEDGINAAKRIHKGSPKTRIILISAYPDREFHRQGLEAGAAAFLDKKNLDLDTIRAIVVDLM
jgi:DNA-binding NarL/FixJ family response regulator